MSSVPLPELSQPKAGGLKSSLILIAATVLALGPFLDKPFHIDDPLFVWGAKHIQNVFKTRPRDFLDFYGFEVMWSDRYEPMYAVTQNPPVALYFLAAAASLPGGFDERWLHAACLLPAIGVVLGTWRLGRDLTQRPILAGLGVICSPIFLVSSTNVMCDTLMVCFWVWSVVFWREGLLKNSPGRLLLGAYLAGIAAMTKYFAISLIPLLLLYTLVWNWRAWWRVLWLLIPIGFLVGYEFWTRHLYGHALEGRGLLENARHFAQLNYQAPAQPLTMKIFGTLAFTGGGIVFLTFYVLRVARNWLETLLAFVILSLIVGALMYYQPAYMRPRGVRPTPVDLALLGSFLVMTGIALVWLLLSDVWYSAPLPRTETRGSGEASPISAGPIGPATPNSPDWQQRLADSLLLGLWVAGTMIFAGAINWTVNGRSILPLIPAAALLVSRALDRALGEIEMPIWEVLPMLPAAVIALLVAHADYRFALAPREAVNAMIEVARNNKVTLWYSGHWGFQYYMDQAGAQPVCYGMPPMEKGDFFALPENNDVHIVSPPESILVTRYPFLMSNWASTHQPDRCTGFYSDAWGALPFSLGQEIQSESKDREAARGNAYDWYRLGQLSKTVRLRPPRRQVESTPQQ